MLIANAERNNKSTSNQTFERTFHICIGFIGLTDTVEYTGSIVSFFYEKCAGRHEKKNKHYTKSSRNYEGGVNK